MNASSAIYAVRWLIKDTFRQAMATRIFWIMLTVSGVFITFCLSLDVSGGVDARLPDDIELYKEGKPITGSGAATKVTMLFGAMTFDSGTRSQQHAVHFLEVLMATMVASYLGFLLTVLWTAGFLPEFLQPANAAVLFAKPVPRWTILTGKYLGVVVFVAFQVTVFFGGTWFALGIKTGIWQTAYLVGIPLLVVNFAVIYSFSVLIAVLTRSTVACVFGTVLFWALCWGANYGHHFIYAAPNLAAGQSDIGPFTAFLSQAGYWMLPKPADMEWILQDALKAGEYFIAIANAPGFQQAIASGAIDKTLSVLTSIAFGVAMLAISSRHLAKTDY